MNNTGKQVAQVAQDIAERDVTYTAKVTVVRTVTATKSSLVAAQRKLLEDQGYAGKSLEEQVREYARYNSADQERTQLVSVDIAGGDVATVVKNAQTAAAFAVDADTAGPVRDF